MTQTIDDELARLAHIMRQLERDARNAEAQAAEWKDVAERQRAEIEHIKQAANALIDEACNPVHDHWNDWVARLKAKADNLNTRVSLHNVNPEPAQSEETQVGTCHAQ